MDEKKKHNRKILHVWTIADVGVTLAEGLDMRGYESRIIIDKKHDETYQNFGAYSTRVRQRFMPRLSTFWVVIQIMREIILWRPDVIIMHKFHAVSKTIKRFFPNKKIIFVLHGLEIRGRWLERHFEKYWLYADKVVCATRDIFIEYFEKQSGGAKLAIAREKICWIKNIVNPYLFYRDMTGGHKNLGHALFMRLHEDFGNAEKVARQYAQKYGLVLVIHDRKREFIKYADLPAFLKQFEYYIDVKVPKNTEKNKKIICETSLTARQAQMMGLIVIDYNGKIRPKEVFDQKKILDRWEEIIHEDL